MTRRIKRDTISPHVLGEWLGLADDTVKRILLGQSKHSWCSGVEVDYLGRPRARIGAVLHLSRSKVSLEVTAEGLRPLEMIGNKGYTHDAAERVRRIEAGRAERAAAKAASK